MKRDISQKGFSTIEILIAFAVGIIFLSSAMMVAFSDPTFTKQISLESGQAAALDTMLDNGGLYRAANTIGSTTKKLVENWNAIFAVATSSGYTSTSSVSDISPCMKQIESNTGWNSLNSRTRNISFGTMLGNIDIARALGPGGCDPTPPAVNGWDNPENPSWETSPSDIDGTQSGLDVVTIGGTPYAFMTTTHSSQKNDLWVIDTFDVTNPHVVSSLETGSTTNANGLIDIDVVTISGKTYAYVIQNSAQNQLQTIDVSDPATLDATDIKSTISLAAYGVNPSGSNPIPKVITYYNGRLYIGLFTTIGPELLVFNVASTPQAPSFVGSLANSFDHSINDIAIRGNYAYLAIAPGSGAGAANTRELMIIDISNPTPTDTGKGFNASSTSNDTEAATTLYLIGSKLYLGRQRVSNALERDFYVFNITDPILPTVVKSKRLGISTGGSMGTPRVIDMIVQGELGFFATTDSAKPFQVFDVTSSLTDIIPVNAGCNNYINLPKLTEIVYKDDLIYGANGNQAALNILHDKPSICGS